MGQQQIGEMPHCLVLPVQSIGTAPVNREEYVIHRRRKQRSKGADHADKSNSPVNKPPQVEMKIQYIVAELIANIMSKHVCLHDMESHGELGILNLEHKVSADTIQISGSEIKVSC